MKLAPWLMMAFCTLAHAAPDNTMAQLVQQTASSRMLIIGEMHGTKEVPALVADLAQRVGKTRPVVVALEWSSGQTGHEAYLASDGSAADRKRMLALPFWSKPYQDGRASAAMLDLIESLRKQARAGANVTVATFDQADGQNPQERDKDMADKLRAIAASHTSARIIVLSGNYHARQMRGAPWNPEYRFMAHYLTDLAPFSLNVTAPRGSYWACSGGKPEDCKMQSYANDAKPGVKKGLYANAELRAIGYNQGLELDRLSVSLPAATVLP
jgi:hypothetical protein